MMTRSRKRKASQAMGAALTGGIQKVKRTVKKKSEPESYMDFKDGQINLITTWPGTGREESKAPTEIYYDGDRVMWGYSVPADAEPFRWFKLLLLRDADLTHEMRRSGILAQGTAMLAEKNKTTTDVIGDYLRGLWRHTMTTIERDRTKAVIDALTLHVVITVPAIWPDYARQGMMDAARQAGILDYRAAGRTTLAFAPEPEAAALATLWDRAPDLKKDDVYMICDAGGGTVDLISYKIHATNPIKLHEAVIGTGGLCGGLFIDEAFEGRCRDRLGRRWRNLSQTGIKNIMKDEWESSVKSQFSCSDPTMEFIINIPAEAFDGNGLLGLNDSSRRPHIKNGRVHFASSDIQSVFDGCFYDIEALVDSQIADAKKNQLFVKGIILVGGLGSSTYLYEYLHAKYSQENIDILQATGMRPRTAICRGAIFKGFIDGPSTRKPGRVILKVPQRVGVVQTVSRKSLGIEVRPSFVEGKHLEEDKVWDDFEGKWKALHQMQWYIRKGENVSKKKPYQQALYRLYTSKAHFENADLCTTVYESTAEEAPTRSTAASVRKLCIIDVSLEDVKYDDLQDVEYGPPDKRTKCKRWDYLLEMVPTGASTEFAVYHRGKQIAAQNVVVTWQ